MEKKKGYIIPASELSRKTNLQSPQNTPSPLLENTAKDEVEQIETELLKIEEKEKSLPQVVESSPDTSNTVVQESDPKSYQTRNTKDPVSNFSLSSIALKKAASKVVQKKIPEEAKPKDPFELEELKVLWTEYIDQLKKERKLNIASILSMNNLEVENSNQILFTVANEMNKAEVNQEMEHLLPFLRKRLNNYEIQIKLIVSEITKEETVSSPTEKYQYLLKLNPALEDLKNKFDLDF